MKILNKVKSWRQSHWGHKINGYYKVRKLSQKIEDILCLGKFFQTPEPFTSNFEYDKIYKLTKTDDVGNDYSFKLRRSRNKCEHGYYEMIDFWFKKDEKLIYSFSNDGKFCFFNYHDENKRGFMAYKECSMMVPFITCWSLKIASLLLYEFCCYRANSYPDLAIASLGITHDSHGDENELRKVALYTRFGYKLTQSKFNDKIYEGKHDSRIKIFINDPQFGFNITLCKNDSLLESK